MRDRATRIALFLAILLLAAFVAEPYVARLFYAEETPRAVTARGDLAPLERANIELFERAAPSVVHVFAQARASRQSLLEGEEEGGGQQTGTGFVWDAAGHIVTNNHVVQNASPIAIRLNSGEIVPAELVGTAPNFDIAVLRLGRVRQPPPAIAIGTSSDLKVGQSAYAIGNPFGLDQTLTTGVISALQRRLPTGSGRELADVIQTDAAINPGNSGGPLIDGAGQVIGINSQIESQSGGNEGVGFAVPIKTAADVISQLENGGSVHRAYLGITGGDITPDIAHALNLPVTQGVLIERVLGGGPAGDAGIKGATGQATIAGQTFPVGGDIITKVDGKPISGMDDVVSAVNDQKP
ncbi:MAG: S1C family serine protease, partial [Microvirga sp.]